MIKLKYILGTGGTLNDRITDEIELLQGIKNAFSILEKDNDFFCEIEEKKLKALIIREVMKSSKGSLDPAFVQKRVNEYLNEYSK